MNFALSDKTHSVIVIVNHVKDKLSNPQDTKSPKYRVFKSHLDNFLSDVIE